MRLVAMMTLTSPIASKPSIWLSSSSMVRWISRSPPDWESYRFVPIASTSSMNTMDGASSSAALNSSRTSLGPSPRYFWMSSEPTTRRKVADVECATAFASRVLPVPGSPYRMTPLGGLMPTSSYSSGWVRGSSTASLISWTWASNPPTSAYDSSGALSTFMTATMGSASSPSTPTTARALACRRTVHPGSRADRSTKDRMET